MQTKDWKSIKAVRSLVLQENLLNTLYDSMIRIQNSIDSFKQCMRQMNPTFIQLFIILLVKCTPDGKAITRPHLTNFENLTYFEYPTEVTLFKEKKDWPKLRDSGFLFFRKVSSESKELLDYIDEQHLLKETEGNKIK